MCVSVCVSVCVWNGIDPLWTVKPQMMRNFHMEATESKLCLYHAPCPGLVASQDEGLSSKPGRRGRSPAQGRQGWVAVMQIKTRAVQHRVHVVSIFLPLLAPLLKQWGKLGLISLRLGAGLKAGG